MRGVMGHSGLGRSPQIAWGRRRSHLYSPLVFAFSFMVILTSYLALITPSVAANPQLIPCPGGIGYVPNCLRIDVTVNTNATNSQIEFELTSVQATLTLIWGNSTSYVFTAFSSVYYANTNQWYSEPLNYLQPNTTYYYKLSGTEPGENPATKTGSWGAGSDVPYLQSSGDTISGTVFDDNGTHAPSGVEVAATCNFKNAPWSLYGDTNSLGQYSIYVGSKGTDNVCLSLIGGAGREGYVLQVENGFCGIIGCNSGDTQWNGRWNETVVVWAPQIVNFYLPTIFVTYGFVNYALFTSSADVNLEFCQVTSSSWSYSTSSSQTWSFLGDGATSQSGVAVSGGFSSGVCSTTYGEPSDEDWGGYLTTGDLMFNGVNARTTSDLWANYYGNEYGGGIGSGGPLSNPISEPTSAATACNAGGINWFQKPVGAHSNINVGLGASGTITALGSDTFSVNYASFLLPLLFIPGLGEATSFLLSALTLTSSQTYSWSTTLTNEFNVTADIVTGATGGDFTVACQGSSSSSHGLAIEVWQDS